jgi:hypothetical protein
MKVQILNGHGGWEFKNLTFIVPQGLKIHFLCNHGDDAHDTKEINDIIKNKNKERKRDEIVDAFKKKGLIKETVPQGEQCFNYSLSHLKGMTSFGSNFVVQVGKGKEENLDKLTTKAHIDENTDIIFYACRAFIGNNARLYGCYSASQVHMIVNCINNMREAGSKALKEAEALEKCLMMGL